MKDWIAGLIEKLGTKLVGAWVTKGITTLAAVLVTHNLMKPGQQESWIAANVDWLSGLALGLLSIWLSKWRNAAHKDEVQTALYTPPPAVPPQQPTPTFGGPSRVLPLLLLGLLSSSAGQAALPTFVPPLITKGLEYIATNGTVGTGYGISADCTEYGVMFSQSLSIQQLRVQLRKTEVIPGVQHATIFGLNSNAPDRSYLGINLVWHWFDVPPWGQEVGAQPVVRRVLWPKIFKEWKLKPSVNYRTDELLRGEFDWPNFAFGIEAAYSF